MRQCGLASLLKRQFEVIVDGRRVFLDAAVPELRIAIELDGLGKRTQRAATIEEYHRQNRLVISGWTVLRFTWDDVVRDPEHVVASIHAAIAAARAAS